MKWLNLFLIFLVVTVGCNTRSYDEKTHLPSEQYEYVTNDQVKNSETNMVYVPIYSHIYMQNGTRITNLAATLSVRSTSFTDSLYISRVDYYSSQGKLIKRYIDKTLLLKPMHSVEFVVEEKEAEGGAGANFVVEWSSLKLKAEPMVQAVMIGTYNNMGISFKTDGIKMQADSISPAKHVKRYAKVK